MTGIGTCLIAHLMFIGAPVPPDPTPDPLGRGYMGIYVQSGTLTIESVERGMPAAKAGIKAQDTIVRVGTLQPDNFKQVVAHICSFRPGAIVEIEVQRGDEKKVFKVKLGLRPAELDQYPVPTDPPPP
jgi:S1-C subfamily serine protease